MPHLREKPRHQDDSQPSGLSSSVLSAPSRPLNSASRLVLHHDICQLEKRWTPDEAAGGEGNIPGNPVHPIPKSQGIVSTPLL